MFQTAEDLNTHVYEQHNRSHKELHLRQIFQIETITWVPLPVLWYLPQEKVNV